jgi:hypothetical protein
MYIYTNACMYNIHLCVCMCSCVCVCVCVCAVYYIHTDECYNIYSDIDICMCVCVCVCVCAQRKETVSFRKSVSDKEKKGFTTSTPDA